MTVRSNAIAAIDAFNAGGQATLSDAASAHSARIEVVNVLYRNEALFPETSFVSDSVQASREASCRGCVKFTTPNMCSECGCPIVFFSSQVKNTCPIGVWS